MFHFGKPQDYLGVDLGAGGVKMVELHGQKGRPVLFTYGLTSDQQNIHSLFIRNDKTLDELLQEKKLPEGREKTSSVAARTPEEDETSKYAAILRAVHTQSKMRATVAVVSLPVSAVFHALVTLPIVKKQEIEHVWKAEIKKLLPYPLEETALDYQIVSTIEGKGQQVLVNAVPRTLVVFYSKVFKQAGLKLDSLEPESMGLARALVGRDTATTMVVDMGAERTNFFIIEKSVPVTHHSIEVGGETTNALLAKILGLEPQLVEQVKRDLFSQPGENRILTKDRLLSVLSPVIDPIIKEIQYGFDLYLRQSGNENKIPEKIILSGGAAQCPYLTEFIANKFKMKCYIGDPWGRVVYQDSLKPVLHAIGPRMSVAIGLALRNMV